MDTVTDIHGHRHGHVETDAHAETQLHTCVHALLGYTPARASVHASAASYVTDTHLRYTLLPTYQESLCLCASREPMSVS